MEETRVRSLGREDPLEKGLATRSSILAWTIPWTEEPGGLQPMGSQRVRQDRGTNTFTSGFGGLRAGVIGRGGHRLPTQWKDSRPLGSASLLDPAHMLRAAAGEVPT